MEPPLTDPDEALVEPNFDAASAATADPGPPSSSDAPGHIQEPLGASGSEQRQPDTEDLVKPAEFDERCKEPFTGLLYLGALDDEFSIWGHRFKIATPSVAEKMQLGALHVPYANTMASEIAYQTLQVAAFLVSVDGHELPKPVLNDAKENAVRDRFEWVANNLRQEVIDEVFGRCMTLNAKVRDALEAMGKARG
jgi:hypothetical protein